MTVEFGIQLRPEVLAFARAMEARLRENDYQPGWWKSHPSGPLFDRVLDKLHELADAIEQSRPAEAVLKEAADVGNVAMIIADCNAALPVEFMTLYIKARQHKYPKQLSVADVEQWHAALSDAAKRGDIDSGSLAAKLFDMTDAAYRFIRDIDRQEREISRLEAALTYYADPNHYDDETNAVGDHVTYQNFEGIEHDFESDCGERAREALGVYIKETLEKRR